MSDPIKTEYRVNAGHTTLWGLYVCEVHGEYWQRVGDHKRGHGCTKCGRHSGAPKKKSYPDWFIDLLRDEEDKKAAREGTLSTTAKVWLVCPEHGEHEAIVHNIVIKSTGEHKTPGNGCKICAYLENHKEFVRNGMRSKAEIQLDEFIQFLGYETQHRPKMIGGVFEVDIYIPKLNIGVEEDGLGHVELPAYVYGSEKAKGHWWYKPEGYHESKDSQAKDQGIDILHVSCNDWYQHKEDTKQRVIQFIKEHENETTI